MLDLDAGLDVFGILDAGRDRVDCCIILSLGVIRANDIEGKVVEEFAGTGVKWLNV